MKVSLIYKLGSRSQRKYSKERELREGRGEWKDKDDHGQDSGTHPCEVGGKEGKNKLGERECQGSAE